MGEEEEATGAVGSEEEEAAEGVVVGVVVGEARTSTWRETQVGKAVVEVEEAAAAAVQRVLLGMEVGIVRGISKRFWGFREVMLPFLPRTVHFNGRNVTNRPAFVQVAVISPFPVLAVVPLRNFIVKGNEHWNALSVLSYRGYAFTRTSRYIHSGTVISRDEIESR